MSYISKALPHPDRLCLNHSQPVTRMLNVEPGDTYEKGQTNDTNKARRKRQRTNISGPPESVAGIFNSGFFTEPPDDRTLADIGLKRDQISDFVKSWSVKNDDAA